MQTQTVRFMQMAALMCSGVVSLAASANESGATAIAQRASASTRENTHPATDGLSIVEPCETDAQCIIDATGAYGVTVSYAAQIADPVRTEAGAGMDMEAAMPFAAARADDELERGDAGARVAPVTMLAQLEPPVPAALPAQAAPRVHAVPLENAARVEEAEPVTQPAPPVRHVLRPARPALLPDARRPVRKPPVSYAAPIAMPVQAAALEVQRVGEGQRVIEAQQAIDAKQAVEAQRALAALSDARTALSAPPAGAVQPARAVVDPIPTSLHSDPAQTAAAALLPAPHSGTRLSYAAPVAVPRHTNDPSSERTPIPAPRAPSAVPPHATNASDDPHWSYSAPAVLSDARLDTMRGGFDLSSGLKVSFGISRMVVVNGNLVTTTSFNIPDIANITAQQAQTLASVNAGALLQNGPGNVVQTGAVPSLSGAVIQNSLNNQSIQALTTINTTVNSLSIFKNLNIGATLNSALTSAVRGR